MYFTEPHNAFPGRITNTEELQPIPRTPADTHKFNTTGIVTATALRRGAKISSGLHTARVPSEIPPG